MKRIPIYKFYRHKYGAELLVDVVEYEKMHAAIIILYFASKWSNI